MIRARGWFETYVTNMDFDFQEVLFFPAMKPEQQTTAANAVATNETPATN